MRKIACRKRPQGETKRGRSQNRSYSSQYSIQLGGGGAGASQEREKQIFHGDWERDYWGTKTPFAAIDSLEGRGIVKNAGGKGVAGGGTLRAKTEKHCDHLRKTTTRLG